VTSPAYGHTHHAFLGYQTYFDYLAVFHDPDQRNQSLIEKIDVADQFAFGVEDLVA
jgi:hypothetical protein